jgi:uncharacterized protein involved in exopolysaccharide biosynthesis
MSQTIDQHNTRKADDELSLKEILGYLNIFKPYWKKFLLYLLIPAIIFGFIGFLAAITSPKEYDAKCVMITDQVASAGSGSLAGLAALAGVSVPTGGGSDGTLGADLYPLILSNKPFLVELSKVPMYFETEKRNITFEEYFKRSIEKNIVEKAKDFILHPIDGFRSIGKKSQPATTITSSPVIKLDTSASNNAEQFLSNETYITELTAENKKMIGILTSRIKFNQTGKMITLSVKMPDPRLSAEATKTVLNLMIKYITKFKVSKQLENLRYLERGTAESEIKYKQAQQRLAGFKDNNYNVIFESVQSKEQQLQNEFSLAFSIYNQFVSQLEQARIQLKRDTPLFTMVEPVYIPEAVSADPNKAIISYVSSGIFIGILLNFLMVFRIIYRNRKKQTVITSQSK